MSSIWSATPNDLHVGLSSHVRTICAVVQRKPHLVPPQRSDDTRDDVSHDSPRAKLRTISSLAVCARLHRDRRVGLPFDHKGHVQGLVAGGVGLRRCGTPCASVDHHHAQAHLAQPPRRHDGRRDGGLAAAAVVRALVPDELGVGCRRCRPRVAGLAAGGNQLEHARWARTLRLHLCHWGHHFAVERAIRPVGDRWRHPARGDGRAARHASAHSRASAASLLMCARRLRLLACGRYVHRLGGHTSQGSCRVRRDVACPHLAPHHWDAVDGGGAPPLGILRHRRPNGALVLRCGTDGGRRRRWWRGRDARCVSRADAALLRRVSGPGGIAGHPGPPLSLLPRALLAPSAD
mmetsp:Transcript_11570/g.35801  ORF Transcript_11570/g.35801 Transcript_11570/m.35801 type:complete len:349 (+) Transcript_11570:400-1446(+)